MFFLWEVACMNLILNFFGGSTVQISLNEFKEHKLHHTIGRKLSLLPRSLKYSIFNVDVSINVTIHWGCNWISQHNRTICSHFGHCLPGPIIKSLSSKKVSCLYIRLAAAVATCEAAYVV
ncbi:unnamed protein product [Vicia faba]|uniref:Secreted protein n=1 Tax=Vicia faba TaxID=3906 RepID=A0AAV0ZT10_VICFA|nr:unnamed protein product [Vicia faba]